MRLRGKKMTVARGKREAMRQIGSKISIKIVGLMCLLSIQVSGSTNLLEFPAVFNFGDSNSDTGELTAGLGFNLSPAYGQSYFKTPFSGRFSDGRLILDFLMEAAGLPLLRSYLDSIGPQTYRRGCNFAAGGSTIQPANTASISPFSFNRQVSQFLTFRSRVLYLVSKDREVEKYWPSEDYFKKGLYVFDIGQNDIAGAFYSKTLDQVLHLIPSILEQFDAGLQRLYDEGGVRNFWIHNTGPLGCLPQLVSKFGTDPSTLDEIGCLVQHNEAAKFFNLQLHALCKKLPEKLPGSSFTHVDIFSIKSDLIANHSLYGFQQGIEACCGTGGPPLNYDSRVGCGRTVMLNGTAVSAKPCRNASQYVNWDGIHYTEAANRFVATKILTGEYSKASFRSSDDTSSKSFGSGK